jgi:hypothetical protein
VVIHRFLLKVKLRCVEWGIWDDDTAFVQSGDSGKELEGEQTARKTGAIKGIGFVWRRGQFEKSGWAGKSKAAAHRRMSVTSQHFCT